MDDSDDDTPDVIRRVSARADLPVRLLHRPPGQRDGGLGGAVVLGLQTSQNPWCVVMDGDLQHLPELVPALLARGVADDVDVVVASRYCGGGTPAAWPDGSGSWCPAGARSSPGPCSRAGCGTAPTR